MLYGNICGLVWCSVVLSFLPHLDVIIAHVFGTGGFVENAKTHQIVPEHCFHCDAVKYRFKSLVLSAFQCFTEEFLHWCVTQAYSLRVNKGEDILYE